MLEPKICVVIVNWNGEKILDKCLMSIINQSYKNYDVILVDNGSLDSSLKIATKYRDLEIIKLKENYGFARANNIGIKSAFQKYDSKYICTLNNDTIADSNFLQELVKIALKDIKIGSVQAKLLFPDGLIQSAGLLFYNDLCGPDKKGISRGFMEFGSKYNTAIEVFAATAGAALYKREMLEKIGLFDEDFFAYAEDLDLGLRARLAGWKSHYAPLAKVIHFHSQTGKASSSFKAYHIRRNTNYAAIKNLPILFLLKYFFSNGLNVSKLLFKINKDNTSINSLVEKTGYFGFMKLSKNIIIDSFKNFSSIMKKRRLIQKNRIISSKEFSLLTRFK